MDDDRNFYQDYYGQLKGYKVKSFDGMIEDDLGGKPFPRFTLTNGKNEVLLEVSRDEEGNGGGFLFISNKEIDDEGIE